MAISTGTRGCLGELQVSLYLLKRGFGCFRNLSSNGIDLILITPRGKVLRCSVKSGRGSEKGQRRNLRGVDVLAVVSPDGDIRFKAKSARTSRQIPNCSTVKPR
jgi:hypothetical protein